MHPPPTLLRARPLFHVKQPEPPAPDNRSSECRCYPAWHDRRHDSVPAKALHAATRPLDTQCVPVDGLPASTAIPRAPPRARPAPSALPSPRSSPPWGCSVPARSGRLRPPTRRDPLPPGPPKHLGPFQSRPPLSPLAGATPGGRTPSECRSLRPARTDEPGLLQSERRIGGVTGALYHPTQRAGDGSSPERSGTPPARASTRVLPRPN